MIRVQLSKVRMVLEDLRELGQGEGVSLYARGRESINEVRLVVMEMGEGGYIGSSQN